MNQELDGFPSNYLLRYLGGVYWRSSRKKWIGYVMHNRERFYVGTFDNLEEAEAAVKNKRDALGFKTNTP